MKRDSSLHGRWSCTDNLTDHLSIRILDHLVLLTLVLDCAQAATRVAPHRVILIRTAHLRLLPSEQIGRKVPGGSPPAQAFVPRLKGNNWELCRAHAFFGGGVSSGSLFSRTSADSSSTQRRCVAAEIIDTTVCTCNHFCAIRPDSMCRCCALEYTCQASYAQSSGVHESQRVRVSQDRIVWQSHAKRHSVPMKNIKPCR